MKDELEIFSEPKLPKKKKKPHFPITHYPPVPKHIFTDDVSIRRMEYLNALSEVSGSTEGTELESLSSSSYDQYKNYSYQEKQDEEDYDDFQ